MNEGVENDKAITQNLGARIKALRLKRNITMAELAKQTGVSRSMISQLENGDVYPSLQSLSRIVDALGVSLSKFFEVENEPGEDEIIVRADHQKVVLMKKTGNRYLILTPNKATNMEFLITEFPVQKDGEMVYDVFSHMGEEYFYVMEGELFLMIGDNNYTIKAGDSGCFNAQLHHYYVNTGDTPAKLLIASSEHAL
ncbi:MAG: helix-turn-helix domain-containing protein [Bacillota bacterium]|nr:helix-turn-helix domain-containing protein [Bacillota bacterium]